MDGPDPSPVHVPYWSKKKKLLYDNSTITIMGSIEFYEMLLAKPDVAGDAGDIGGGDIASGGGGGDSSAVVSGDGPIKRAGWLERSADMIYAYRTNDWGLLKYYVEKYENMGRTMPDLVRSLFRTGPVR